MFENEFNRLTERQREFLLEWLGEYLQPCDTMNYECPAMELKQCFSCLFFYITKEQFTHAMAKLGFQVEETDKNDYVFNVHPKSKMFVMFRLEKKPEQELPNFNYIP